MSDKRKVCPNKPPVPARPKNLVVLNSKHLPKPPETFSTDNVRNFIKDLDLDIKDEGGDLSLDAAKSRGSKCNSINSDWEDETYGYLEPVSLSSASLQGSGKDMNGQQAQRKTSFVNKEENCKLGEIFNKLMMRNNSAASEGHDSEETKPPMSQNQWQRPLPLPPVEVNPDVTTMPWFKDVDRKRGEDILRNGADGYFLVRPSSNADTYLTLTLWYNERTYNIPIRKRKDGKFALGTPKANEQCFDSVQSLVKNYQSEKLVLYSNGVQTGKTLLTKYPP